MLRRLFPLFAALCAGCVPVTQPVGDIDKVGPDKALVGKWSAAKARGTPVVFNIKSLTVDAPEVKGNPKGLMRAIMNPGNNESELWFFTTTVGKHTYANVLLGAADRTDVPRFAGEGNFARWKKGIKRYFVFRYVRDGDTLTIDCGNNETFAALMKDAKIRGDGGKPFEYFDTPAGWLARHLDKTGPGKLFDGRNSLELTRDKE
jgi:hypothetical protein